MKPRCPLEVQHDRWWEDTPAHQKLCTCRSTHRQTCRSTNRIIASHNVQRKQRQKSDQVKARVSFIVFAPSLVVIFRVGFDLFRRQVITNTNSFWGGGPLLKKKQEFPKIQCAHCSAPFHPKLNVGRNEL